MSDQRPLPIVTDENGPYWAAAREHRLVLPACEHCNRLFYPISPACPNCFAERTEWQQVSGYGVVSSFVVFHQAFYRFFRDRVPYAVVQVELKEGPRVNGNMLDVEPHDIRIGMPVKTVFEKVNDTITLPQFAPTEEVW